MRALDGLPVQLALTLVVAALIAPAADARQRAPRMTFSLAERIAVDYWAKRAVVIPCAPTRRVLTGQEEANLNAAFGYRVDMVTYPGTCEVQITPMAEAWRTDRDLGWVYCVDVAHEVGHIAGLTHAYGGVMAATPTELPWGCAHPRRFLRLATQTRDGRPSSRALRGTAAWQKAAR